MGQFLLVVAAVVLGLQAGALLAEGGVLVPFWRSIPVADFQDWYRENGERLVRFFGPLEVLAAILSAAAFVSTLIDDERNAGWSGAALAAAVIVLLTFPLYFKAANEHFTSTSVDEPDVTDELARWSRWHWGRTIVAVGACAAATFAVAI